MKKLKQYKYRGWMQAGGFFFLLLCGAIVGIVRKDIEVFIMPVLPCGFLMVMGFVQQRKLTEEEWRHEQAQDDERSRMLWGKAAYISWFVTLIAIFAGAIWATFAESDLCLYILLGILMIHTFAFLIVYAVLKKKN